MAVSETTQKLDVHGTRLAIDSHGRGEPVVILVSGLGDAGATWSSVIERLEDTTRLVTYDRAGCGQSDDLPDWNAAVPRPSSWAAGQLHDLLCAAEIQHSIVLVGHSLGAQIADAFAVRYPDLVAGLVLVDGVDPDLNLRTEPPRPVSDDAEPARAGRGWQWDASGSTAEFYATQPRTRPPAVVIASAIWRWFRAKHPERYKPLSLAEVDQAWQLAQLQYARRWGAQLVVAHQAGHRVHEDAPDLVAAVVAAVVNSVRACHRPELDAELLHQAGGSVRPTDSASGL